MIDSNINVMCVGIGKVKNGVYFLKYFIYNGIYKLLGIFFFKNLLLEFFLL